MSQVVSLLNLYEIHLLGDHGMYTCMMKTNESEAVKMFRLQPPAAK
jgi:hypothetical protein